MRAPRIRKLRRRGDVAGLVAALGYVEPVYVGDGSYVDSGVDLRVKALRALADLASPSDVPEIAIALQDPDPTVRRLGVRVVRKLGPESAVEALAATLAGPADAAFVEARLEALEALEELESRGVERIARPVALAVVDGGDRVALDHVTRDALMGFVEQGPAQDASALVEALVDRLPSMNGALENGQVVLSWLGDHSVSPLIEALEREGGYREPAVAVLGSIRDSQALGPLAGILEDRRPHVRRVAVWALGELHDPRAAEALMRATMDDEYIVRRQAGEALDAMGSIALMAGVANMIRSLEDRPDGRTVARLVEEGLERMPATSARDDDNGWAPRFVDRLQLGPHT